MLEELNLPFYGANVKTSGGRMLIQDVVRRKFVALTPEEWVRQHFVHYLMDEKGYPQERLANEVALTLNGMTRRCDTVVYGVGAEGRLQPRMIIEYKRAGVEITQRVFDQICRYNMVLQVDYLVVSNGLRHFCCKMNESRTGYVFLEDIPEWKDVKSGDERQK